MGIICNYMIEYLHLKIIFFPAFAKCISQNHSSQSNIHKDCSLMSNYEVILCYFLFFYGWMEVYEQLLLSKSTDFDFPMLFLSLSKFLELLENTFFFFLMVFTKVVKT